MSMPLLSLTWVLALLRLPSAAVLVSPPLSDVSVVFEAGSCVFVGLVPPARQRSSDLDLVSRPPSGFKKNGEGMPNSLTCTFSFTGYRRRYTAANLSPYGTAVPSGIFEQCSLDVSVLPPCRILFFLDV